MKAFGKTDTGIVRKNNEDTIFYKSYDDELKNLCIVADGMGGHNAGEIASRSAIEYFLEYFNDKYEKGEFDNILYLMADAVTLSNAEVYKNSFKDDAYKGMGTTFLATVNYKGVLNVCHIGDSRLYVYRNEELKQITEDHALVTDLIKRGEITEEEARVHPNRNVITRSLGTSENVLVDTYEIDIEDDDIFIMCSDGLNTMLDDERIKRIVAGEESIEAMVESLIVEAKFEGGFDNVSVIIMRNEVDK
ncbi:MAG: Stp1/IreP family PP2C-type Ser/Thr phosphatase [Firmicutes bacterium]|nr:Stp1/IreP family PP2C-type Ser/Thr phosphatase [Bacillota bacterium]